MIKHLDTYLSGFDKDLKYRNAIAAAADRFNEEVIDHFDFVSYKQCLMYGDVQSGKTSHVLGVIAAALDQGFEQVLFLTSDNTRLVDQTFKRIHGAFPFAEVCGPDDEFRFRIANESKDQFIGPEKPTIITLNKNASVLRRWKNILATTDALHGKPLLIVDDEADAGSLNSKVNKGQVSPVNGELTKIRSQSPACIYIQVTGTPQSILLQASIDNWRPDYYISFSPGAGYIGGEQLFDELPNNYVRGLGDSGPSEKLEFSRAVRTFVVSAAMLQRRNRSCNMLIHPSRIKEDHNSARADAVREVDFLRKNFRTPEVQESIEKIWAEDLSRTVRSDETLGKVIESVQEFLSKSEISFRIINSDSDNSVENDLRTGNSIVIGGDSLGRGLTIPALQTVFYSRATKTPQADTLWQHARMFGYDRELEYLRIFMPGPIAKNFHEVHKGNEAIKSQLDQGLKLESINVQLDGSVKPTRASVLNKAFLSPLVGGVNYFAANPKVKDMRGLDQMLTGFTSEPEGLNEVSTKALISLLQCIEADADDFPVANFISALQNFVEKNPAHKSALVCRSGRKVSQGTGSLLSPNDRKLSDSINNTAILTMYRIEGNLGWSSNPIWVPNLKLPTGAVYYRTSNV